VDNREIMGAQYWSEKKGATMSTKENLATAFAGESQANRKYLAFAEQAEEDGMPHVARLFRATAAAETIHAHAHLRAMGGVKSTLDNLKEAIEGEGYEFEEMYPPFLAEADEEGDVKAKVSFRYAMGVEEIHHGLYKEALEAVQAGNDLDAAPVHVCDVCGNTVRGKAPDRCPVCGAGKKHFFAVD
jgi:rubrerythrin